jgi:hypothetical protein
MTAQENLSPAQFPKNTIVRHKKDHRTGVTVQDSFVNDKGERTSVDWDNANRVPSTIAVKHLEVIDATERVGKWQ